MKNTDEWKVPFKALTEGLLVHPWNEKYDIIYLKLIDKYLSSGKSSEIIVDVNQTIFKIFKNRSDFGKFCSNLSYLLDKYSNSQIISAINKILLQYRNMPGKFNPKNISDFIDWFDLFKEFIKAQPDLQKEHDGFYFLQNYFDRALNRKKFSS